MTAPYMQKPPSIWDRMQNVVAPSPQGMSGLLSEDDIKGARNQGLLGFGTALLAQSGPTAGPPVGFGAAIGRAGQSGMAAYQGAIDASGQRAQAKQGFDLNKLKIGQAQTEIAQAAKVQAARQAVFTANPPPPESASPKDVVAWVDKVTPALVSAQDFEGAEKLTTFRKALAEKHNLQAVQTGDAVYTFNPEDGSYTKGPERHMSADELKMKQLTLDEQRARTSAMQGEAAERSLRTQSAGFQTRNKDLMARALPINQAILSVRTAGNDPTLYKTAIASFVQAADQKAQLRSQMLEFFSQADPSVRGKWESLKTKLLEGKLPAYQRQQMLSHLENLMAQTRGEWDRRRNGEIKRHADLAGWIPPGDEIFNTEDAAASAAPNPADRPSLDNLWGGQ